MTFFKLLKKVIMYDPMNPWITISVTPSLFRVSSVDAMKILKKHTNYTWIARGESADLDTGATIYHQDNGRWIVYDNDTKGTTKDFVGKAKTHLYTR